MSVHIGNHRTQTLMVGDRPATIELLRNRLEKQFSDSKLTIVETSAKALEYREKNKGDPFLCFVDLKMPDAMGVESDEVGLQLIAKLSRQPRTLVVAFSGSADTNDPNSTKAHNAGAVEFVCKDIETEVLTEKVAGYIRQLTGDVPDRPEDLDVLEPIDPIWARQLREEHEWLGNPENLETYSGTVVALFNGEVWASGSDQRSALRAVRARVAEHASEPGVPAPYELHYLVIPDWIAVRRQRPVR